MTGHDEANTGGTSLASPPSSSNGATPGGGSPPDPSATRQSSTGWGRLGLVLAAGALLYLGGWYLLWGKDLGLLAGKVTYINGGHNALVQQSDVYMGHGIAVLVNGSYYGALFEARFFDAPALSFAFFFLGAGLVARALR
jgi:hypothetical protein